MTRIFQRWPGPWSKIIGKNGVYIDGELKTPVESPVVLRSQMAITMVGRYTLNPGRPRVDHVWFQRLKQGLTLVHFSAQLKRILSDRIAFRDCLGGVRGY